MMTILKKETTKFPGNSIPISLIHHRQIVKVAVNRNKHVTTRLVSGSAKIGVHFISFVLFEK